MTLTTAIESSSIRKPDTGNSATGKGAKDFDKQTDAGHGRRLGPVLVFICCGVILLGSALHFVGVDKKDCWFDEAIALQINATHSGDLRKLEAVPIQVGAMRMLLDVRGVNPLTTLENIRVFAPDQGPVYSLIAWATARLFGNNVDTLRALSGVFSLLLAPLMFWLIVEATSRGDSGGDKLAALIGATLIAVSPVFTLYAGEARPYIVTVVMVLLAHVYLLRAVRTNRFFDWFAYSLFMTGATLSHLTVGVLLAAHCLYLLCRRANVKTVALVAAPSLLALLGWAAFLGVNVIKDYFAKPSFVQTVWPLARYLNALRQNLALSLFDGKTITLMEPGSNIQSAVLFAEYAIVIIAVASWLVLVSRRSLTQTVVALGLFVPSLVLCAADVFLGGHRACVTRYGLLIDVSAIFAIAITASHLWNLSPGPLSAISPAPLSAENAKFPLARGVSSGWRTVCVAALSLLICLGLLSQLIIANATWVWTKSYHQDEIVRGRMWLEEHKKPLLLVGHIPYGIAMVQDLRGDVNFEVVGSRFAHSVKGAAIPDGTDAIFVVRGDRRLVNQLRRIYPPTILRVFDDFTF